MPAGCPINRYNGTCWCNKEENEPSKSMFRASPLACSHVITNGRATQLASSPQPEPVSMKSKSGADFDDGRDDDDDEVASPPFSP